MKREHDNKGYEDDTQKDKKDLSNAKHEDIELRFKSLTDDDIDIGNYEPPLSMLRKQSALSLQESLYTTDTLIELDFLFWNQRTNAHYWVERSRWLIYQEDYDIDLKRFSSPHLSSMSIKGFLLFKKLFKNGFVSFTNNAQNYLDILNICSNSVANSGKFTNQELIDIRQTLTFNHIRVDPQVPFHSSMVYNIYYNYDKQCFEANDHNNVSTSAHSQKTLEEGASPATEGVLVRVGILETISEVHSLFIRLETPILAHEIMDNRGPLRCVYIVFGPKSREEELMEVGRVFAILMSNKDFREIAYHTDSIDGIIFATKRILECSLLLHMDRRITVDTLVHSYPDLKSYVRRFIKEQQEKTLKKSKNPISIDNDAIKPNLVNNGDGTLIITSFGRTTEEKEEKKITTVMKQFIPPFHQVYLDFKGLKTRYLSDYKDAFIPENAPIVFTGIIFLYFVVLSPAITFGALYNALVSPRMTITMLLIASGSFQLLYMLFAGQPLEVIGITPTMFVVEQVLSSLSVSLSIQLEVIRFWIGVYVSMLGLVFTVFNGSVVIQHFRRSVEEVYNTYYSIIFILSSLFTMFKALPYIATPLNATSVNATIYYNERVKFGIGGSTLFLALVMLNVCLYLVKINRGIYLSRSVRKILGAFNVPLGIIIIVALSMIFFPAYQLPTLNIPDTNNINVSQWVNFPPLRDVIATGAAMHGYCFCIGLSMFFMLVVEVSTNSISVVKAERRLQKHTLYSLNYLCMLVFFPIISIFLGWPFHSGAMVRSNAHCIAMAKWSANSAPGVPKKVIGQCEQRISGIIVSILVFLSVFLGSVLRYIPLASMYGMFLYMGVMGVSDMIMWKRLVCLMKRRKHWRDHDYLKEFPTWNIRIIVLFQLFFISILVILYIISQFTPNVWALFLFPLFVGMYALIRGYALPHWPRLNTHLSKMDKKHVAKLYDGKKQIVKVEENANLAVIAVEIAEEADDLSSISGSESEIY